MRDLFRQLWTHHRLIFLGAVGLGVALCFLPMVGVIGPESAVVLGVVLPPFAAYLGAHAGHRRRQDKDRAGVALLEALCLVWLISALPVALLALNALRVKTCAPLAGLSFIALGPLSGVSFAAVLGASLGLLSPTRWHATVVATCIPVLALVVSLYELWATPAVFAYGHFFGYFPGTVYDRNVQIPEAVWYLRGLTAAMTIGVWTLTDALWRAAHGPRVSSLHAVLLAACCATCLSGAYQAESWGIRTSSAWIESQLGRKVRGERCVLVLPREYPLEQALLLAEDCDFEVERHEQTLGVQLEKHVVAFFFRDSTEKRRLMGAEHVYIAKPWRDEVYLQLSGWPHPVLSHELAHVVAGRAGKGPFRIAGVWGGFRPEPILIEGLAVALTWRSRDGLTADQWARAARDAEDTPSLRQLMGAGFFSHNQQLAYTLAGSFLHFVAKQHGPVALRKTYATGDVEAATNSRLPELEKAWQAHLETVPLPPSALALAKQRFERPGVFGEVCPHEIERLRLELRGAQVAGDYSTAIKRCQEILEIDPLDADSGAALVAGLATSGKVDEAEAALKRLLQAPHTPRPTLAQARTALADAAWRAGNLERATNMVEALLAEPQNEASLRTLEVKSLALHATAEQRRFLRELLVGDGRGATDPRVSVHAIERLARLRGDGLGPYLLARQLLRANRFDLALDALRESLARGLPLSRLTREAFRLSGTSAFAEGQFELARQSFAALSAHQDATLVERLTAERWQQRLDYVLR